MDSLFENAQRIFDVARSAGSEGNDDNQDFALLIGPDGVLHFVMESPFSIEAAAIHAGAQSAYRITRSPDGVRVQGRNGARECVIREHGRDYGRAHGGEWNPRRELLRDQPLYRITSPLLTSCAAVLS